MCKKVFFFAPVCELGAKMPDKAKVYNSLLRQALVAMIFMHLFAQYESFYYVMISVLFFYSTDT